jgi:uncharacterized membrane protein HdeD (DUF308 family)
VFYKEGSLKPRMLVGVLLIIVGVIALAYQGITYTTHKKVLDIGPIEATKEQHKTIPLPPIVGGVALLGGVILLVAGGKNQ